MRRFKLHTGKAKVYDLTKEIYLSETKKDAHYSITGKDGCKRNFAVCPACDNPIQILGLYKKLANTDNHMENIIIIVLLLQLIMRQRIGYVLMLDIIIMLQEKAEKKKLQNMNGLFIILHGKTSTSLCIYWSKILGFILQKI